MRTFRIRRLATVPMRAVRTATLKTTYGLTTWAYRPKVVAIECPGCGRWVSPRNYEHNVYLCKTCAPADAYTRFTNRPMTGGRQGVLVTAEPIRSRRAVTV
ncbi:hypothetical protein [Hamadaea tsunoensis]|uniref:hypothetical protein n=1 Tax=Hamadaea tsunoensis TaxID=53368 RepID=UPI0012FB81D1|nr:hypothetical protein [Hamadaea tsunoensis]